MRRVLAARAIVLLLSMSASAMAVGPVVAQEPSIESIDGLQRVTVPDASIAVSFPADWAVDIEMVEDELVPTDPDRASIRWWNVLYAERGDGLWCQLQRYEWAGHDPADLADGIVRNYAEERGDETTTDVSTVELGIGDAVRVELVDAVDGAIVYYFFESDGSLYDLSCMGEERDLVDAADIAGTLGWADPGSAPGPDAVSDAPPVNWVTDFSSVVEVADGLLMNADCDLAMWAAYEDGSFKEGISCVLSEVPVDDPDLQGLWPTETVTVSGGTCEWVSDFWTVTDGSEIWATSYELTVTPDGHVQGTSTYSAELLECTED